MQDATPQNTAQHISGRQFECTVRTGYVHIRVWSSATTRDSEAATQAVIKLAREHNLSALMVNLEELEWVSNLPLRRRMIELFRESMTVLDRVALVASRPAILYLVSIIARASGIKVATFQTENKAAGWLTHTSRAS